MPRILIVEDDTDINNSTAQYLRRQGCECVQAFSGTEGRLLWQGGGMDLLLVDLMLPGLSGSELIAEIRQTSRTPVIVLSAKTELSDKVELLGLGADDYLAKPFGMMEMVSRVKAVLRRCRPEEKRRILRMGGIELNKEEHTVFADRQPVVLTLKEYDLLELFMEETGRVFTREQLLQNIWRTDYEGESRTVDVHIGTLRSKLGACGAYIKTVRGVGYRMEARL